MQKITVKDAGTINFFLEMAETCHAADMAPNAFGWYKAAASYAASVAGKTGEAGRQVALFAVRYGRKTVCEF